MRKLLSFIFNIVLYGAIVGAIVWGVPRYLSWKLDTTYPIAAITSGSMWPQLKRGDVVLIKHVPKNEIAMGDIVVWRNEKGFTIHRVVKLDADTLTTKGDANFANDPPVRYEDVIGKTVSFGSHTLRIPYVGLIAVLAGEYRRGVAQEVPADN